MKLMCIIGFCLLAIESARGTEPLSFQHVEAKRTHLAAAPLQVTSFSPSLTSISLSNPDIEIMGMNSGLESYRLAVMDGEPFLCEPEAPALPHVTRLYRIPETGGVDLIIHSAEFELIDNYDAFPYPKEDNSPEGQRLDRSIYERDAWYPPQIAVISDPMIFRDFRVVSVSLYPVQVNPAMRQARLYHDIDVDIVANNEAGVNELPYPRRPSAAFEPLYRDYISNLDDGALDDLNSIPGSYLILARDNASLNPWVDSLAEWRTRCGFHVVLQRYATVPAANAMRTFISDLYESSDPPLEHVCIFGDPVSPSYGLPSNDSELDHYFSHIAGNDLIPDVSIGRISMTSPTQANTFWQKLVSYERDPAVDSTEWQSKSLLYAIVGMDEPTNLLTVQWANQQLQYYTGVQNNFIDLANGQANGTVIQQHFAEGIGLFYYAGFWLGTLQENTANNCMSGAHQPVCLLMAGATGHFNYSTSLSESFVFAGTPADPRGGVCALGYLGSDEWGAYFRTYGAGFIHGMTMLNTDRVGLTQIVAQLELERTFGPNHSGYVSRAKRVNIIGDPATRMWTAIPQILSVSHSQTFFTGTREISVMVSDSVTGNPLANALVTAWKEDEVLSALALTDSMGRATLSVVLDSLGILKLTVTKQNCKPYLSDSPCIHPEEWVAYDHALIDDDNLNGTQGNGDGLFNPGEVIDLAVTVKNHGISQTATELSGWLESLSDRVAVLTAAADYPDLAPSQSAVGLSNFRIEISQDVRQGEQLLLRLHMISQDTIASAIEFFAQAGDAHMADYSFITDPLRPGETAEITISIVNNGAIPMSGVHGRLVSQTPYVLIPVALAEFGDIGVGDSVANSTAFSLAADSATFPGQEAPLQLILETSDGYRDTAEFVITVGMKTPFDPVGPDAYGYYAYDNVDSNYTERPQFEYMDITQGLGEALGINDTGEKTTHTQIWSVVRDLPFDFMYYGNVFDQITICSNGWIAFGNESWCDEPFDRPIPAVVAPPNLVAVYWDDLKISMNNNGVWSYFDPVRQIDVIQWRGFGGGFDYTQAALDFQILLLSPDHYPSLDGNGKIVFMYLDVTMNLDPVSYNDPGGCTIGIQNETGSAGLQIAHRLDYAPGTGEIIGGTQILLTTDGPPPPSPSDKPDDVLPVLPAEYALHQNYPNPFNPSTTISYDLKASGHTKLTVYNVVGQEVVTLIDGMQEAGQHIVHFNATGIPSGVYFYRLTSGDFTKTAKMVLMK